MQSAIAPVLISVVSQALEAFNEHSSEETVVPVQKSMIIAMTCGMLPSSSYTLLRLIKGPDRCEWTMGLVSWICQLCGAMCCLTCHPSRALCEERCAHSRMVLASMMALPELRRLEQDLKHAPQNCLETPEVRGSLAKMIDAALDPTNRSIPVIEGECPQVDFESIWSRALPLVVRGAPGLLYDWSPQSLSSLLGDDSCDIIDCETSRVARTTVDAFFRDLIGDAKSGAPILKLKVASSMAPCRLYLTDAIYIHIGLS